MEVACSYCKNHLQRFSFLNFKFICSMFMYFLNLLQINNLFCFFLDPQRVNNHGNISETNNELNDSFKEDLPSVPRHRKLERMRDKTPRAQRESVRNLHVPVRERAAQFERIVADIRYSSSESSSRSSSISSPPLSPRGSQQMSFGWERELELRLGVNRSRESSQQSSSTSRSGSSRTHMPVSRSISSGSMFSDYRQSYSSDDVPFESLHRKDSNMPEHCRIEREDLHSARIIRNPRVPSSQGDHELYENIDEHQEPVFDGSAEESESAVKQDGGIYAVYLDEDDLVTEYPVEQQKEGKEYMDGYHSDGYHGDTDNKEMVSDEVSSKSAGEKQLYFACKS